MAYQGLEYEIEAVSQEAIDSGIVNNTGTAQLPDGNFVGSGQPSGNWVDVPGLVNLECMDAPISENKILADELKTLEETMAVNLRHVFIPLYLPQITTVMRWVMDGINWDILGVESDSQKQQTRLHLKVASI